MISSASGYVTHTALTHLGTLSRLEAQLVNSVPLEDMNSRLKMESRARLLVDNFTGVVATESIDRTAAGRLLHSMLASVNEYHSRNMGDEIKRKSFQKVLGGGSLGPAPLGYKNVGEGGVRYVVIDPEPARLIQWAFEAYATGEWSVKSLLVEATVRGL